MANFSLPESIVRQIQQQLSGLGTLPPESPEAEKKRLRKDSPSGLNYIPTTPEELEVINTVLDLRENAPDLQETPALQLNNTLGLNNKTAEEKLKFYKDKNPEPEEFKKLEAGIKHISMLQKIREEIGEGKPIPEKLLPDVLQKITEERKQLEARPDNMQDELSRKRLADVKSTEAVLKDYDPQKPLSKDAQRISRQAISELEQDTEAKSPKLSELFAKAPETITTILAEGIANDRRPLETISSQTPSGQESSRISSFLPNNTAGIVDMTVVSRDALNPITIESKKGELKVTIPGATFKRDRLDAVTTLKQYSGTNLPEVIYKPDAAPENGTISFKAGQANIDVSAASGQVVNLSKVGGLTDSTVPQINVSGEAEIRLSKNSTVLLKLDNNSKVIRLPASAISDTGTTMKPDKRSIDLTRTSTEFSYAIENDAAFRIPLKEGGIEWNDRSIVRERTEPEPIVLAHTYTGKRVVTHDYSRTTNAELSEKLLADAQKNIPPLPSTRDNQILRLESESGQNTVDIPIILNKELVFENPEAFEKALTNARKQLTEMDKKMGVVPPPMPAGAVPTESKAR